MPRDETSLSPVRRLIVSQILIVLIIILSYGAFRLLYAQKPEVQRKQTEVVSLNVDVFTVESIDFQELLTGFGTVRADREVIIAAQVSGEIVEVHPQLKVGSAVTAGGAVSTPAGPSSQREPDVLMKIDPRDYRQRLDQAANRIEETRTEAAGLRVQLASVERQLEQAKVVLNTLNEELQRIRTGFDRNVSTPSELNRATLEVQRYEDTIIQLQSQATTIPHQIAAAQQRLASALSEQQRAQNDLTRTEVVPPFDGTLSEVYVEQGRYVRAGEQLVRLTDIATVEIPVAVRFDDFLQLQSELVRGQHPNAALAVNETDNPLWRGHVVRAAPEADTRSRTIQVFVEVTNSADNSPLLPGTFIHARIDGMIHRQRVLIPREAVVDGTVFVVDHEGIARRRTIRTGRRFQSLVLAEEGLQDGDRVIMTNLDIVEEGREVVVQSVTDPEKEIAGLSSPVIRPVTSVP
ncbi:MAG: efflux RND transporter periplasmic adaptor subunit [Fuerstiella sp.]